MTTERDEAVLAVQTAIAETDDYADEFDYYRPHALAAIAALRDGEAQQPEAQAVAIPADSVDGELSVEKAINELCEIHPGADRLAMKLLAALFTHRTVVRYKAGTHPTTPPVEPSSKGVTDEMVEAARNAAMSIKHNKEAWFPMTERRLRRAIAAALATKPAKGGEEG